MWRTRKGSLIRTTCSPLQAASCTYRIAFGPRAGHKVLSLQYAASRAARRTISGGLIRKPGLVLAGANGTARLALVQARGVGKIGRCEAQIPGGNSEA